MGRYRIPINGRDLGQLKSKIYNLREYRARTFTRGSDTNSPWLILETDRDLPPRELNRIRSSGYNIQVQDSRLRR